MHHHQIPGFRAWLPLLVVLLASARAAPANSARTSADEVPQWRFAMRLYNDERARQIGDLVTVIIEEQSSANRSAEQSGGKSTSGSGSASVSHPFYTRGANGQQTVNGPWISATLPAYNWQFGNDYSGGGQLRSEEGLRSTLTARVLDILPNGNLLIEGRRLVEMQEEQIELILTGMVRARDISAENTVLSSRLADASIRYETAGPLTRDQRRGLLTRLINWLNPF